MGDIDFKKIGLAAKDILFGAAQAGAGIKGGPAAADGVGKAGDGIDRLLGMTGVIEPPSRAEQFDRADFAARNPVVASVPKLEPTPSPTLPDKQESNDEKLVYDHLRRIGWSPQKIREMLGGAEQGSAVAILARETKGLRVPDGQVLSGPPKRGTRVRLVDGTRTKLADATPLPTVDGERLADPFANDKAT